MGMLIVSLESINEDLQMLHVSENALHREEKCGVSLIRLVLLFLCNQALLGKELKTP